MKCLYFLPAIFSFFLSSKLIGQAGTIDKTFGNNGTQLTKLSNNFENISCAVIYPDGKIISAGANCMVRNKANGTIDSSFGNNGKTYDGNRVVSAIALQPDNKIVVSANYYKTVSEFTAIKYLSNGKADPSFGVNGIAIYPVSANTAGIGIQSNGKILIAGTTIAAHSKAIIVRFNVNGTIDSTFGINGLATLISTVTGNLEAVDILINSNDKIFLAANSRTKTGDVFVCRLNVNGSTDSSFGTNGFIAAAQLYIASPKRCLAMQTDGKIVIGGSTTNDTSQFGLVRFLPNGNWDVNFGHNGFTHTAFAKWFTDLSGITLQPDGKIVAVGSITDYSPNNFGLAAARFSSDGSLDESFSENGKISRMDKTFRIHANAIGLQSNGKIIIAGYADSGNVNSPKRFAFVSRLNNDQPAMAASNVSNMQPSASNKLIQVFPNPVKDVLHIIHVPYQSAIAVVNNNGVVLIRKENVSGEVDIATAKLNPGIYTLRIIKDNSITSLNFLKQ